MTEALAAEAQGDMPWADAVRLWWDALPDRRAQHTLRSHLKWLAPYLEELRLGQIDIALIARIRADKVKTGVKPVTVNQCLAVLRSVLRKAHQDFGWQREPPPVPMFTQAARDTERLRWLTHEEAQRLRTVLPDWLAEAYWFSLHTGLRKLNVWNLIWGQVDLERRQVLIPAAQMKTKRPFRLSLNSEAVAVLRRAEFKHPQWVFTKDGEHCPELGGPSWLAALKRAGIEDFHWHDIRHTHFSWLAQAGTPLAVLKELGGWGNIQTVMRYAHLCPDNLHDWVEQTVQKPRIREVK